MNPAHTMANAADTVRPLAAEAAWGTIVSSLGEMRLIRDRYAMLCADYREAVLCGRDAEADRIGSLVRIAQADFDRTLGNIAGQIRVLAGIPDDKKGSPDAG